MTNPSATTLKPRKVFRKKGACSNAMFHLLNHEFNNLKPDAEKASDMLAGGIAQRGHQCGMIWGAAMAVGAEADRRFSDKNQATAEAIHASGLLMESFEKRANTVNCEAFTKTDFSKTTHLIRYSIKVLSRGMIYSPCFNLIVDWTPEALLASYQGLADDVPYSTPCLSCASELLKKKGASEEEVMMVAGFAGGIGLSGEACGALSAAIWYRMLEWKQKNPDKDPSMFKNPEAKNILEVFDNQTDGEMLCRNICKQSFSSINEHSDFIRNGGCKELLEELAKV